MISKKSKGRIRSKETFVLRDPKDRWSVKACRAKSVRSNEGKRATAEKPILRPQLRAEARKRIGDTGLLDHLLKHMAGKLAPGGEERFRRRHNPDGAMEYWLESADLVNIRRDAGVADPYWVPPPGWKPGDSPTQDPICARELKLLKDDISKIKRDLELMVTKVKLEEEVGKLRRELEEISSKKRQDEIQASKIASSRSDISQKLDQLATSLSSSRHDLDSPVLWEKCKEQLMTISDFVREIEVAPNVEERARKDSSLMVPTETHIKEKKPVAREPKSKQEEVQALIAAGKETSELGKDQNKGRSVAAAAAEAEKTAGGSSSSAAAAAAAEEKAAKIQRLKSGFRICKPQGTFLWPNMLPPTAPWESSAYGARNVMGYEEKGYNACCSSSATSLPSQVGNWLALNTLKSASDDTGNMHG
ncbi:UNVERIFIED_CONTAM: protein DYAD [Sesamum radiatum]|uniref:Protein DYAD n=1 Tax=Sesamum radiatum TaxID=300843 RepID=A0AAW2JVN8_SESRA